MGNQRARLLCSKTGAHRAPVPAHREAAERLHHKGQLLAGILIKEKLVIPQIELYYFETGLPSIPRPLDNLPCSHVRLNLRRVLDKPGIHFSLYFKTFEFPHYFILKLGKQHVSPMMYFSPFSTTRTSTPW